MNQEEHRKVRLQSKLEGELEVMPSLSKRIAEKIVNIENCILLRENVFNDPVLYSKAVARSSNTEAGGEIRELLSGKMCRVFSFNGTRYIDFDVDYPAVFAIGMVLYIYEKSN